MNKARSSLITNRSSLNDTATESSTAERALRPGKGQRLARRGLCLGIDDPLPAYTRDEGVLAERFAGCLLGGAVGDALGRPLEGGSLAAHLALNGSRITGSGTAGDLGRKVRSRTTPNSLCGSCSR